MGNRIKVANIAKFRKKKLQKRPAWLIGGGGAEADVGNAGDRGGGGALLAALAKTGDD